MNTYQNLTQWFNAFFKRRNLQGPDGRQLFEYHPNFSEFQELKQVLRSAYLPTSWRQSEIFWQGYVLFSAFCFAYLYREDIWAWRIIDEALGIQDISHASRRDGIIVGAKRWKIQSKIQNQGKKFIGFVLGQAGVPIAALKLQNSWIATLIVAAIRFYREWHSSAERIKNDLKRYAYRIPDSFNEEDALDVVVQAALIIDRAIETQSLGHRQFLAKEFPSFEITESDLNDILSQYKKASKAERGKLLLNSSRYLVINNNNPILVLETVLERTKTTVDELANTLRIPKSCIQNARGFYLGNQSFAAISLLNDEEILLKPNGNTSHKKLKFTQEKALGAISARVITRSKESINGIASLIGASEIDSSEPLVFKKNQNGHEERWYLCGTGSCSIPATEALVMIPKQGIVHSKHETIAHILGYQLIKIHDSITVEVDGALSLIKLNDSDAFNPEEFFPIGERLEFSINGKPIYKGVPRIFSRHLGTYQEKQELNVRWVNALRDVVNPEYEGFGVYTAQVLRDGSIVKRLHFAIVPRDATISYEFASDSSFGLIGFDNWNLADCECSVAIDKKAGSRSTYHAFAKVPYQEIKPVNFILYGKKSQKPVRLELPYPQRHCAFMLGDKTLSEDKPISLAEAFDLRIDIMDQTASMDDYILNIRPNINLGSHSLAALLDYEIPIPVLSKGQLTQLFFNDIKAVIYRCLKYCRSVNTELVLELLGRNRRHIRSIFVKQFGRNIVVNKLNPTALTLINPKTKSDNVNPALLLLATKYPLVAHPLWSENQSPIELGSVRENLLHESILETLDKSQAWMISVDGDTRYHTRPAIVPPQETKDSVVNLLVNGCPPLDYMATQPQIRELFFGKNQSFNVWVQLIELINQIGVRGIAFLPLWKQLKEHKSLALAICLSLDLVCNTGADRRSSTLSVARTQGWRWDLMSQKELDDAANRIFRFMCHQNQKIFFQSFVKNFTELLEMDVFTEFPSLRNRVTLACAKACSHCKDIPNDLFFGLCNRLQNTPLKALMKSPLKQWRTIKDLYGETLMLGVRPQKYENSLSQQLVDAIRLNFIKELKSEKAAIADYLSKNIENDLCIGEYKTQSRMLYIPILIAVTMELMGVHIENPLNERQSLLLFEAETILNEFPQWAGWCQEFAVVLIEHMRQNKIIGA